MADENLNKRKEKIKLWMMRELSKMKERDISSGLLKKVMVNGKEECVLNEDVVSPELLVPFDVKETIFIDFFCKHHYIKWKSKIDIYRTWYGKNSFVDNVFVFNEYKKFNDYYVSKASGLSVKKFRCRWNSKECIFDFRSYFNSTIYYNISGKLDFVLVYKGSGDNEEVEKVIFTYNDRNLPKIIFTYKLESQILISTVKLFYDNEDRIIKEEVTNYHSSNQYDYTEIVSYEHEYKENYHKVTYYQEPKFTYLDDNNEEVEDVMVEYSIEEAFNTMGKIVESKFYNNEEGLEDFNKYVYSNEGNLLSTFSLDEDGNVLLETKYKGNKVIKTDRKNSKSNSVDEFYLQHNSKGHWIKECTLRNGNLKWIEEREIKYFD